MTGPQLGLLLLGTCLALLPQSRGEPVSLPVSLFGLTDTNLTSKRSDSSTALVAAGDGKVQLKLCECERATGAPSGLSCNKQGWFITSFERQGQWVAGGGFVPLSHAICCRPCLPNELPPDPSGRIPDGEKPLAIVSLGCHPSTDELPVRCEGSGRSFASGFSEAVRVFTAADTFYPVNTINCCTPSLLLENGDAWELERCDCHDSHDPTYPINCGGLDTDELLFGYIFYRMSPLGHLVPVGPAQCCKVCLSPAMHPMDQCDDLGQCSHNGVCNMGACECFEGWAGADCSKYVGRGGDGGHHGIPPWAITLIVLSSCALAGVFLVTAGHIVRILQEGDGGGGSEAGDERQPLILRIDADDAGSVGSQDTECDEDELEEVQERVNTVIARLEDRTPGVSDDYHPPAVVLEGISPLPSPRVGARPQPQDLSPLASPRAAVGASTQPSAGTSPRAAPADAAPDAATRTPLELSDAAPVAAASIAGVRGSEGAQQAQQQRGQQTEQLAAEGSSAVAPAEVGVRPVAAPQPGAPITEAGSPATAAEPGPVATADAGPAPAALALSAGQGTTPSVASKEDLEEAGGLLGRARGGPDPLSPLSVVDCIVCMSRPVQVVLVPCGHICCCRRCSRKLTRCPVCRKDIARRQRLFI